MCQYPLVSTPRRGLRGRGPGNRGLTVPQPPVAANLSQSPDPAQDCQHRDAGHKSATQMRTSTCMFAPRSGTSKASTDVNLQSKAERKVSKTNPCTNLPMRCEICLGDYFVWKFSMQVHLNLCHGGAVVIWASGSNAFKARVTISPDERSRVLALPSRSMRRSTKWPRKDDKGDRRIRPVSEGTESDK